jgi:2-polyprenyl-3-methyl-5-hydroxy-6-metoxy-1,4-benzoquinol methylase
MRSGSFGQHRRDTLVDRFGIWLSERQVRRFSGEPVGIDLLDAGCGFHARLGSAMALRGARVTCLDTALAPELGALAGVTRIQGLLPDALDGLAPASFDRVLALSVLEHLWQPGAALAGFHRLLRPGGRLLINVPSWRGKRWLEFSAFRLGLSPAEEMDDHKTYYDPRDLWPLLVQAGFRPSGIRCFRHKFGLNTFAVCEKTSI